MVFSFINLTLEKHGQNTPYPLWCQYNDVILLSITVRGKMYSIAMGVKISAELREAMRKVAQAYGSEGGKKAARNSTPEERSARAKKASMAAAKKRTAERIAREKGKRKRR